jgi:hypothetical protein
MRVRFWRPCPGFMGSNSKTPQHNQSKQGWLSGPTPLPPRMTREAGKHEVLTLCQKFCEHFSDPAVYLAGVWKWIADSAQNLNESWRKPVDCRWNRATR